jgi:large subunit ribosomal protein L4
MLSALECEGRVLLVLDKPTDDGAAEKSFRNLQHVRIAYAGGIGTYDVLLADQIVFTADALDALEGSTDGRTAAEPAQPKAQAKPEPKSEAEAEDTDGGDDA